MKNLTSQRVKRTQRKEKPTHLICLMQKIEHLEPQTIVNAWPITAGGHLLKWSFVTTIHGERKVSDAMPSQVKVLAPLVKRRSKTNATKAENATLDRMVASS